MTSPRRSPRRSLSRSVVPFVFLASVASAQRVVRWTDDWDGPSGLDDLVSKIEVGPQGDVFVVGRSFNPAAPIPGAQPTQDALVARWSAAGALQWARRIDRSNGDDTAVDLAIDPATGDVVVVGSSTGPSGSSSTSDVWVARFDAAGNTLWSTYWNGPASGLDSATSVLIDPTGAIDVGGISYGGLVTRTDVVVLRFDASGAFQWQARVNGGGFVSDNGGYLAMHPSGDVVVAGQLTGLSSNTNIGVARIDPNGSIAWQYELDGAAFGADSGLDVACDALGNVYVAGSTTIGADLAPTVAKWDASGLLQWQYDYPEPAAGNGQFRAVEVDALGRVDVLGSAPSVASGIDLLTIQLDAAGNVLWERRLDGAAHRDDSARTLVVDAASDVIVCGWSNGPSGTTSDADALVASYASNGDLRWSRAGDDPTNEDRAQDVAVGPNATVAYASVHRAATSEDVLVVTLGDQGFPFCFGDGSSGPCPCGNESAVGAGAGCKNSLGRAARLVDTGVASLSSDSLVLNGSEMPNASAQYIQGAVAASPAPMLGDGLLCASGTLIRIGTKANAGNASHYPEPGNASVSVRGQVTTPGSRVYQIWYRNAASFCTPATFNLSNGLLVSWVP